ncbi:hypothetical protein V2J09_019956 [Rumex salicifolius]
MGKELWENPQEEKDEIKTGDRPAGTWLLFRLLEDGFLAQSYWIHQYDLQFHNSSDSPHQFACSVSDSGTQIQFNFQIHPVVIVEMGVSKSNNEGSVNRPRIAVDPAFARFFSQVPLKLQNILKSRINLFKKPDQRKDSFLLGSKEQKKSNFKVDLDKQLQLWRENPTWDVQTPCIDVRVPKGSLCNLYVSCELGLPPDAVYNIVIDPDNRRVFKNIKEVISRKVLFDDGTRQVVDLDQAAIWKFLWWSGTLSVHVVVDQNREDYSMKFKQVKSGFMKKFEGHWRVEPVFVDEDVCSPFKPQTLSEYNSCTRGKGRIGSRISLDQLLQPAIVPPPPISWYLRGVTTKTTEMLIEDLAAEAARIKGVYELESRTEDHLESTRDETNELENARDIKERWALRRRNARHCRVRW